VRHGSDDLAVGGHGFEMGACNRARSASGKGADMIHPPKKVESQTEHIGNPTIHVSPEKL
jgi:hypothetical protein